MNKLISVLNKYSRIDLFVVIALHIVVRLIVYSKIPFKYYTIDHNIHYLDSVVLRRNLLGSLRDLHMQPPLFNAFLGIMLKLFPTYNPLILSALYFLMGLAISCLSYLIVIHLTKRRLVSIVAACTVMLFPPLIQADRWLLYIYPVTLLLLCACFFIIHIQKNIGVQISFIAICAAIALTRSFFHLIVWLVPVLFLFLFLMVRFNRAARYKALVICLLAWILSSVPYFRNYAGYGMFTSSTFQGHNIAVMTTYIGEKDIASMISQGKVTPLARIARLSPPEVYYNYFHKKPRTGREVLDASYKFSGAINWNNEIYAIASKEYQQNTLKLIKAYPGAYLKAVLNELYIFFGTEPYRFWRERSEWLKFCENSVTHSAVDIGRLAGIPLLIFGMYLMALTGLILRVGSDIKKYSISETINSRRCEIFMLFNLVYVLLIANLLELGEGCFLRMPIDPFMIIVAAVFITDNAPGFLGMHRWNTIFRKEPQEVPMQKTAFIKWMTAGGIAILFAGLCIWYIYVLFNGPMFPGEAANEKHIAIVKSYEEIIEDCKRTIRNKPDDVEAYNNLGVAYSKLKRYNEAVKALRQAIRIKPDCVPVYNNLGALYIQVGRFNKAIKVFRQAIRIQPNDADAYSFMGLIYNTTGRYQEAMDAFKEAVRIQPDNAAAHYNLGRAYLIAGDTKSALNECRILKNLDEDITQNLLKLILR